MPIQANIRTWRVIGHDTGSSTVVILRLVPNAMASWLRSDAAWIYWQLAPREDVRHKTIERVLSDQSADPGDRKFAGQHLLPAPEQTRVECERWRLSPRRLRRYRQTSSATRNRAQLCRRTLHPHLCLLAPPRVRGLRVSPAVPPAGWRPRTAIHRWNSRLAPEPSSAVL